MCYINTKRQYHTVLWNICALLVLSMGCHKCYHFYYALKPRITSCMKGFILITSMIKCWEDGQKPSGQKPSTEIFPTRTKAQHQFCHLGQKPSTNFGANNNRYLQGLYQQIHTWALTKDTYRTYNNRSIQGI